MVAALSSSCTFAPPKSGIPGFHPASDVLEIGPESAVRDQHGGWDAGGETARETENLATWGCESGRGGVAREIRGAGQVERQNSRFSESGHSDSHIRSL